MIKKGTKVIHPTFGEGVIKHIDHENDPTNLKIIVDFEEVGQKTLRTKYAKLKKVEKSQVKSKKATKKAPAEEPVTRTTLKLNWGAPKYSDHWPRGQVTTTRKSIKIKFTKLYEQQMDPNQTWNLTDIRKKKAIRRAQALMRFTQIWQNNFGREICVVINLCELHESGQNTLIPSVHHTLIATLQYFLEQDDVIFDGDPAGYSDDAYFLDLAIAQINQLSPDLVSNA